MGTRSRLILLRRTQPHIYLSIHWDGYFNGQGTTLCKQMQKLLAKYSRKELYEMVEQIHMENIDDYQFFSGEHLSAFLEGTQMFYNDTCEDIEFEYVLDCKKGYLSGFSLNRGITFTLTFPLLKEGITFGELESHLENDN